MIHINTQLQSFSPPLIFNFKGDMTARHICCNDVYVALF